MSRVPSVVTTSVPFLTGKISVTPPSTELTFRILRFSSRDCTVPLKAWCEAALVILSMTGNLLAPCSCAVASITESSKAEVRKASGRPQPQSASRHDTRGLTCLAVKEESKIGIKVELVTVNSRLGLMLGEPRLAVKYCIVRRPSAPFAPSVHRAWQSGRATEAGITEEGGNSSCTFPRADGTQTPRMLKITLLNSPRLYDGCPPHGFRRFWIRPLCACSGCRISL